MQNSTGSPAVVQPQAGKKMMVIGNEVTLKLDCAQTQGAAYVFEAIIRPGEGVPPHVHQHEDEVIHVMEGEFRVFLEGKMFTAGPGAVINFPRKIAHGFKNAGTKPAKALFTVMPGANFEKFFVELSALPADRPPDLQKVAEIFARYNLDIVPQSAN